MGRSVHPELAVNTADDEVEAAEDLLGIVERSVGQDVRLDPLENVKATIERRMEPVDLSVLFVDLGDTEPARIMCRLRMVGDADIAVAMAAASSCHRLQGVDTI